MYDFIYGRQKFWVLVTVVVVVSDCGTKAGGWRGTARSGGCNGDCMPVD